MSEAYEDCITGRLRFLVYRCYKCSRIHTKYDILKVWAKAETLLKETGEALTALCPCGSRMIQPTNTTLWEELTTPKLWVVIYRDVLVPWLRKRFS